MWDITRIVGVKNAMQRTKAEMQAIHDKAAAEITRLEVDGSRSDNWKRETIAEVRNRALAALGPGMRSLSERATPVRAQSRFWESRNLLLGLQRFDEDPAKDSAIRHAPSGRVVRAGTGRAPTGRRPCARGQRSPAALASPPGRQAPCRRQGLDRGRRVRREGPRAGRSPCRHPRLRSARCGGRTHRRPDQRQIDADAEDGAGACHGATERKRATNRIWAFEP
jgi:hypothetical protein